MLARNEQKQQILQPNVPVATFSESVLPITLCALLISFPKSSASPLFRRLKATGYESGTQLILATTTRKLLPCASASQTKFGHLNIERTEQPTDKHAKQLTIVSAENLQEDLDDSIMSSRYVRVYKNRALAGSDMHRTEGISNDELKSFPSILFNNSQTNNYKSSEL